MTRRRRRRPRGRGKKPSGRLRSGGRRNTAKWKRNGRKCDRKSGTRWEISYSSSFFLLSFFLSFFFSLFFFSPLFLRVYSRWKGARGREINFSGELCVEQSAVNPISPYEFEMGEGAFSSRDVGEESYDRYDEKHKKHFFFRIEFSKLDFWKLPSRFRSIAWIYSCYSLQLNLFTGKSRRCCWIICRITMY